MVPLSRQQPPTLATLGPLQSAAALWQADEMWKLYLYFVYLYFNFCVQVLTFETYVLTYVYNF